MADIILRNCQLHGEDHLVNIAITDGNITNIAAEIEENASQEIDCEGNLVTPPYIEPHIHLDSVLTAGDPQFNQSGTLFEGIQIWGERKKSLSYEDVHDRALEALKLMAQHGTLYVRTHVDVTEPSLTALGALIDLREEVKDWMTLQITAFPQDGIYSRAENAGLLTQALDKGADVVGAIPHYELTREDGVKSLHHIFDLAEQYDCLIDVHCDEVDDEQSRFVEVLVAESIKRDCGKKVSASHTTAFGSYNDSYAYKLMGFIKRTDVNFIANPLINITLQGRTDTYPKRRGLTRIKELWQNEVNICVGADCIFDPWYIMGTGNMLDVAYMTVHVSQMTGLSEIDACFDMITKNSAQALAIDDYGIAVGNPANIVVMDVPNAFDAIRYRPAPKAVISQGKLIAMTSAPTVDFAIFGVELS